MTKNEKREWERKGMVKKSTFLCIVVFCYCWRQVLVHDMTAMGGLTYINMLTCLYIFSICIYFSCLIFLSFIPFFLCLIFFPQGFLILDPFLPEKWWPEVLSRTEFLRPQNFCSSEPLLLYIEHIRKRNTLFCRCLKGNQLHLLGNQMHLFFLEYIYFSFFLSFSWSSLCSSHLFLYSTIFFLLVLSLFQFFTQTHFISHSNFLSCSTQYFHSSFFCAHFHSSFSLFLSL